MSNRQLSPLAKQLIEARAKIADINNWCSEQEGEWGRFEHKMCFLLAIGGASSEAYEPLIESAYKIYGRNGLVAINELGHEAVMRVLDDAISVELNKVKTESVNND